MMTNFKKLNWQQASSPLTTKSPLKVSKEATDDLRYYLSVDLAMGVWDESRTFKSYPHMFTGSDFTEASNVSMPSKTMSMKLLLAGVFGDSSNSIVIR